MKLALFCNYVPCLLLTCDPPRSQSPRRCRLEEDGSAVLAAVCVDRTIHGLGYL